MSGMAILAGAREAPEGFLPVHWSRRDVPEGHLSLPTLLEDRLIQIRTEHMRWAWEVGVDTTPNGQTLAGMLECGAMPSMWWTSLIYERHPKLSPNLYPIYKLRRLEMLIGEEGIESVLLLNGDRRLDAVLAAMCSSLGVRYRQSGTSAGKAAATSLKRKIYQVIPAPLRALLRLGHWWWNIRRHLPPLKDTAPGWETRAAESLPTATITTYFPNIDIKEAGEGRFRSRYWESLHAALNHQANYEKPGGPHFVRWLLIRFPSPQLNFSQCRKLRDLFQARGKDGLSFNYLEEFLTPTALREAVRRWWRIRAKSLELEPAFQTKCHFRDSKLNFWPYIKEQWAESFRGWRSLERCLQNQAFRNYYRRAGVQRWNLFPLENCPWERMLTVACRQQRSGPIYGAQHSIIRPTDFRYFDDPRSFLDANGFQPDILAGNGDSACGQWLDNGVPSSRLRRVEALRYLYLAQQPARKVPLAKNIPPEPGEPLANVGQRRLLTLTSFFADETQAHLDLLAKSLAAGILKGWRIILKPHPYLSVQQWLNGLAPEWQRQIRITDGPMALELQPGIHVWASNSTTAALEAALEELPLMVMLPMNDFDLCPIQNIPNLPRTGVIEDVRVNLATMRPLVIKPGYLDLNPGLDAWRLLLKLDYPAN